MIIRWYLMIIKIRIHAFDLDSHYIYKYNFKVVSTRLKYQAVRAPLYYYAHPILNSSIYK